MKSQIWSRTTESAIQFAAIRGCVKISGYVEGKRQVHGHAIMEVKNYLYLNSVAATVKYVVGDSGS